MSSSDEIVVLSSQKKKRPPPVAVEIPLPDFLKDPKHTKKGCTETSDSDEAILQPRRKLKRKPASPLIVPSDSDKSEEPVASSPAKRRRSTMEVDADVPQTPRTTTQQGQDQIDIEEDLEDLQDSGTVRSVHGFGGLLTWFIIVVKKTRTRGRAVESARDKRQKHLEALRRKRAGLKEESDAESEEPAESAARAEPVVGWRHPAEDSDVETSISSNEDLDRYEDDFVLEDENDQLGVPTEEIPFEFTRHAYKQSKEYFRDVVEWMVHNKLNPAFPRSNALYKVAFNKIEDEVKGRTGSQLVSSVWNNSFRRALLARPNIEMTAYPTMEHHTCDACNRTNHPASADMKLYGKAYSLETLEPLTDESSDDERSEVERDRDGHVLPDENTRFLLGKHCKANAAIAHTLTHWRFHLNEWVINYLEHLGHMDDDEILKRNGMSQKRKTKNADAVVDEMVEAGEIEKFWHDFHLSLKNAREKTVCHCYFGS